MKKYIKATVAPYTTLKDWVEQNTGIINDRQGIVVRDFDNNSRDELPYCTLFDGSFRDLRLFQGDGNYFDSYDELAEYEVSDVSEDGFGYALIVSVYYVG